MSCKQWLVVVCVLSLFQSGCGSRAPVEITQDVQAVADGNNQFATELYGRLLSDDAKNLCFSPYSVSTALAMTYAGAAGRTKDEMAETLHFSLSDEKLHPAFNTLRDVVTFNNDTPGFRICVANRLWGQRGVPFLPTFQQLVRDRYGADLGLVDFQQAEAVRTTINSWIDEQTEGKIPNAMAPGMLDGDTRLVLTNAIYFKAKWTYEFFERATYPAPFHVSRTQDVVVPMMRRGAELRYGAADGVRIVELPYGKDKSLSLLILLPNETDGLGDLEKQLTSENLRKWTSSMQSRSIGIFLPRFKMTSEISLKESLDSMGMSLPFSRKNAEFSGMSPERPLFISDVIHKVFVDVNEAGTEAAAATSSKLAASPAALDTIEFVADHPFVFLIRENRTQAILFLGRLVNPAL